MSGTTIVPNVEDRHAGSPSTLEQRGDALEHLGGVVGRRVSRDHPLLDVDDDERGRHDSVPAGLEESLYLLLSCGGGLGMVAHRAEAIGHPRG